MHCIDCALTRPPADFSHPPGDSRAAQKSALAGVVHDKRTEAELGQLLTDLKKRASELDAVQVPMLETRWRNVTAYCVAPMLGLDWIYMCLQRRTMSVETEPTVASHATHPSARCASATNQSICHRSWLL